VPRPAPRRAPERRDPYEGLLGPAGPALRLRRMFGCWAYYVEERLVWVSAAGREPWRGILVPTEHAHHAALRESLPGLRAHPVLRKWLYLPARHPGFEDAADKLAEMIAAGDARVGVAGGVRGAGRRGRARKERSA